MKALFNNYFFNSQINRITIYDNDPRYTSQQIAYLKYKKVC